MYKTILKEIFTYQKKSARVIFFADRLAHAKPLMFDMNALNFYQMIIHQNLVLFYKAYTGTAPSIFFNKFQRSIIIIRQVPKLTMKLTNFAISRRGPILWNTVLDAILKVIKTLPLFKAKVKEMLLSRDNELSFF